MAGGAKGLGLGGTNQRGWSYRAGVGLLGSNQSADRIGWPSLRGEQACIKVKGTKNYRLGRAWARQGPHRDRPCLREITGGSKSWGWG